MLELNPLSILEDPRICIILADPIYSARRELVRYAVEVSFVASLQLNEGRQVRFSMAIEDNVLKTTQVARFDPPLPLEARFLQSLSPALVQESDCFVVEASDSQAVAGMIVGTAPVPQAELLPSSMYPRPIILSANGPGRISIAVGEWKLSYDRGRLRDNSLNQIVEIWLDIASEHSTEIARRCFTDNSLPYGLHGHPSLDIDSWREHRNEYLEIARNYAPKLMSVVVEMLVQQVQASEHGGAFMLLPSRFQKDVLFHGECWYSSIRTELSEAIFKLIALNSIYSLALADKSIYPREMLPSAPEELQKLKRLEQNDALINLRRQCQRVARLANADGAVVLNTMFGLEAFSAKLIVDNQELPEELASFLGSRGNRHNSMARTIARVSGAIGVVVSQDGNAVLFYNQPQHQVRQLSCHYESKSSSNRAIHQDQGHGGRVGSIWNRLTPTASFERYAAIQHYVWRSFAPVLSPHSKPCHTDF